MYALADSDREGVKVGGCGGYDSVSDSGLAICERPAANTNGKDASAMKINWREVLKFLSGAFFVTAGASWYLSWYHIGVPFFGTTMTPEFLGARGFIHFAFFLLSSTSDT